MAGPAHYSGILKRGCSQFGGVSGKFAVGSSPGSHIVAQDPVAGAYCLWPPGFPGISAEHRDGRYSHDALLRILGPEDTDRALCNSHHQVFSEWLRFSLAEQKSDLDEYLSVAGSSRRAFDYHHLMPPTARDVERQLYLTDLETLLELLKYEHGGAFLMPGA